MEESKKVHAEYADDDHFSGHCRDVYEDWCITTIGMSAEELVDPLKRAEAIRRYYKDKCVYKDEQVLQLFNVIPRRYRCHEHVKRIIYEKSDIILLWILSLFVFITYQKIYT
jgi:hypothetical protein